MARTVYRVVKPSGFHWVGDGFHGLNYDIPPGTVNSLMDPFLMVGFAPPREFSASETPRGVGVHPHAGFETITLVYQGELEHADSEGNSGVIPEGGVQWMTAGRGILHKEYHSEAFSRSGGTLSMSQVWLNLPVASKHTRPGYQDIRPEDIPTVHLHDGAEVRVIAGSLDGTAGPAQTHTAVSVYDVWMENGSSVDVPVEKDHNVMVLVVDGSGGVNGERAEYQDFVLINRDGGGVVIDSGGRSRFVVFAGAPLREPVMQYGPFVASSSEELMQFFDDYESGRMGQL